MALYSVKKSRGRKIKKYRKSRRGKGRGKRSLKCGKTRRYKVFKNTKNHTLGKRKGKGKGRQMMGGMRDLNFNSDNIRIMDYINVTYKDEFFENGIPETGFTSMVFIMGIQTMITNTSKWLRKDNKRQRILIYACFLNGTLKCYALVRVPDKGLYATPEPPVVLDADQNLLPLTNAQKSKIPIDGMDAKILFIFPGKSNFTSEYIDANQHGVWKKLEFQSFISSDGDIYKILVPNNDSVAKLDELLSPPITSEEDQRYDLGHRIYQ
jgi:hypothetical protein